MDGSLCKPWSCCLSRWVASWSQRRLMCPCCFDTEGPGSCLAPCLAACVEAGCDSHRCYKGLLSSLVGSYLGVLCRSTAVYRCCSWQQLDVLLGRGFLIVTSQALFLALMGSNFRVISDIYAKPKCEAWWHSVALS